MKAMDRPIEAERMRDFIASADRVKPISPLNAALDLLDAERRRASHWRALSSVFFLLGFWAGYSLF